MKIRTQFGIITSIFAVLLIAISASLYVTNEQVAKLDGQQAIADEVEREVNELSYLSTEYLLYRDPAQRERWQSRFSALSGDLSRLDLNSPELSVIIGELNRNKEQLAAVFAALPSVDSSPADLAPARADWSRFQVPHQDLIFNASVLSARLNQESDQLKSANLLLILALIAVFGVFFLVNTTLIYRRVLRSIEELETGTRTVGAGDLDYQIADARKDEVGDLARAFNRMTLDLKKATASKADLEREISERQEAERARAELLLREQEARATAESAVRLRDQFISIASHELKTPLTSIRGYAELLVERGQSAGIDETFRRMAATIRSQSERLGNLIAAMLDISRIDQGQLKLERRPVDLGALTTSIVHEVEPTLRLHNIELSGEMEGLYVTGDASRLEQVMENLIQNAVKYSPHGGPIKVHLSKENANARVAVTDCGIGVPPSQLHRLFTQFYRADNADAYHISGLGVGLYVSQEIVRMHGGEITVESEEGKGSTFTVSLPLSKGSEPDQLFDSSIPGEQGSRKTV